jgi:hypothetical protein
MMVFNFLKRKMMKIVTMREIHLPKASRNTEIAHGMGYDRD